MTKHLVAWALLLAPLLASAEATRGVSWSAPATWKTEVPGRDQIARFTIAAAAPDAEGAEAVVALTPGPEGPVIAWRKQFELAEWRDLPSKNVKVAGLDVMRVELSGTYSPTPGKGKKQRGWALVAAFVSAPQGCVVFHLLGPKKTVAQGRADFDALVASLKPQAR